MLTREEQDKILSQVRIMLTTRGTHSVRVYRNSMSPYQMKYTAERQMQDLEDLLKEVG